MEFLNAIAEFVSSNREVVMGFAVAAVILFGAIAKRTANQTDDKIFSVIARWLKLK